MDHNVNFGPLAGDGSLTFTDNNFKTKLFTRIAKALKGTVEEVYDDLQMKPSFIPPFSSLVLSRSQKKSGIIKNMLELREEFAETRKGFNEMELHRRGSTNLKERLKISRHQKKLLEDAAKSFDKTSKIDLDATIKYIPGVIQAASSPSDITKYSSSLLLVPYDLLVTWWRKRPVRKMYSIKKKGFEINEYGGLLNNLFPGLSFENDWNLRKLSK